MAIRPGIRIRVHHSHPVRNLHLLLPDEDDRRHAVRGIRQLHQTLPRPAFLVVRGTRDHLHRRPGADHAMPGGTHGPGTRLDEASRHKVLPHLHLPSICGAGRGVHVDLGIHVRGQVRSGRLAERLVRHAYRRARPERPAGGNRQYRDLGVHGLQHAHLLLEPVHHSPQPLRSCVH